MNRLVVERWKDEGGGREEIAQRLYFQRKAFLFITNYGGFFRVDIFQI